MAAIVLTLTLTAIIAGVAWLILGSRLRLHEDARQNDLLNLLSYAGIALVPTFVIVFFAMERL
jgi:ABC-type sulfate transport system permease subunit